MQKSVKRKFRASDIFSVSLYWQGIKNLRFVGIFGIITVVIPSLLTLFFGIMAYITPFGDNNLTPFHIDIFKVFYMLSAFSSSIIVLIQSPIYPIVAVTSVFSFLNKRKACDFYHAIPYSRFSLFNSYYLAAVSWILLILIPGTFAIAIGSAAVSSIDPIEAILRDVPNTLLSTLCLMPMVALAKAATGTKFSNTIVMLTLIFSLTAIENELLAYLRDITPALKSSELLQEFIRSTQLTGLYSFQSLNEILDNGLDFTSIALIARLILFYVLAIIAFCMRKSETAGRMTSRSLTTHILCALFVFPMILSVITTILEASTPVSYTLCALPIIIYITVGAITNKSLIKALKSIPVFIIAVVLAIALIFGIRALGSYLQSSLTDTSVEGVSEKDNASTIPASLEWI